jgi:phosphoglycerate dehydrogenase-like enzyme
MDRLLRASDFVTLHVPLTPATTDLIDREALGRMKPTAYLINASRGGVVDEDALAEAVADGRLAGAALDVFAEEPPSPGSRILGARGVLVSPHSAGCTEEALAAMSVAVAESVVAVARGERPPGIVTARPGTSP